MLKYIYFNKLCSFRYFLATLPGRPGVRHLFKVQDASTHEDTDPDVPVCLTCNTALSLLSEPPPAPTEPPTVDDGEVIIKTNTTSEPDDVCQYARAKMSKDFTYYVLDCLGPDVPHSSVYSLPDNELVKVLDDNQDLQDSIGKLAMPKTKELQFDIPGTIVPARVKLLLPPGFRENEEFTFALILRV